MSVNIRVPRGIAALLFGLVAALAPLPTRAEPLTILLDWFINPDHGPLVVALEKGYFAEAAWRSPWSSRPTPTTRPSWSPPARPRSPSPTSRSCTCRPPPACR